MKEYAILVSKAFDGIPFSSYIKRLCHFIKYPDIGSCYASQQQREMSFVDIFNGLGLLSLVVSIMLLIDKSFDLLKIILALNPLYTVFFWVVNALSFSLSFSMMHTFVIGLSNSPRKYELRYNIFNLFTHGLRFYAAYGFF